MFRDLAGQLCVKFTTDYIKTLRLCGGDIFQTQLFCYDRMTDRRKELNADPYFSKMHRLMELNHGFDIQRMLKTDGGCALADELLQAVDLKLFAHQDREFINAAFMLTLTAMATALLDYMAFPDQKDQIRKQLVLRLEIIRGGSTNGGQAAAAAEG